MTNEENKQNPEEMVSIELICPMYHERMDFFLPNMIFDEDEWKDNAFIEKYHLDARYRDYKILSDQDYPPGFPLENVVHSLPNNESVVISLRAMHRIVCSDVFKDSIHFMNDGFVKWKVLNYDNSHGAILKFLIHTHEIPVKYEAFLKFHEDNKTYRLPVFHLDSLWNMDMMSGFLLYYLEYNIHNEPSLKSMYIDNKIIEYISLIPSIKK